MIADLTPEQHWECPNCNATHVTHEAQPHTAMHNCRELKGLSVPFVPAGTRCKIEPHEREDYISAELVQTDGDGRPVMSVVTTRDDGEDCTVYAPTAHSFAQAASVGNNKSGRSVFVGGWSAQGTGG